MVHFEILGAFQTVVSHCIIVYKISEFNNVSTAVDYQHKHSEQFNLGTERYSN